jgi:hypothetical protein
VSGNQQHRHTLIGIILGGAISAGSVLIGVLGVIHGFLDTLSSVTLYVPGSIAGILIGGAIGGVTSTVGVTLCTLATMGLLYCLVNATPDADYHFVDGTTNDLAGGAISIATFGTIVIFLIRRITKFGNTTPGWRADKNLSVTLASFLLPVTVRHDYIEEWQAWLRDLRISGEPWHRRFVELLSIVLIAAPKLAIAHRLWRRRAVD